MISASQIKQTIRPSGMIAQQITHLLSQAMYADICTIGILSQNPFQKDDELVLLYAMAFMYAAIISMNSALLGAWVSTLPAISFSASLSPCAQQVPISVRRACSTE